MISLLVTSDGSGCPMCFFNRSSTNFAISSGLFPRESPSDIPFKTGKSRDNLLDFCESSKPWRLELIFQLINWVAKKKEGKVTAEAIYGVELEIFEPDFERGG